MAAVMASGVEGAELASHAFPVSYDAVSKDLPSLWTDHRPHV